MAKHEMKAPWERTISYEVPTDEFYKARIAKLEEENMRLKAEANENAEMYGMGKRSFEKLYKEVAEENDRLRERNMKLEQALIREAIRDVSV